MRERPSERKQAAGEPAVRSSQSLWSNDTSTTRAAAKTRRRYSAKNTALISGSVLKFSDLFVNDANGTSDLLRRANNLIRVAEYRSPNRKVLPLYVRRRVYIGCSASRERATEPSDPTTTTYVSGWGRFTYKAYE